VENKQVKLMVVMLIYLLPSTALIPEDLETQGLQTLIYA
jgi:hypothetical protein